MGRAIGWGRVGGGPLPLLFACVERLVGQGRLISTQRMAARIAESFAEGSWVLVGIQARGYALAQRLKKALYHFLTQTFFLGGTSPQRTCSLGWGCSKCPSYHPPTPYTLSPLLKGGEGRGEGGSYTRMPCPFGALLVTLYHLKSKAFLM